MCQIKHVIKHHKYAAKQCRVVSVTPPNACNVCGLASVGKQRASGAAAVRVGWYRTVPAIIKLQIGSISSCEASIDSIPFRRYLRKSNFQGTWFIGLNCVVQEGKVNRHIRCKAGPLTVGSLIVWF